MVATSSGSRDGETDILFSADSGVENYDGREASECHATGIDITQCHDADMNKLGTKRYDKRPFWGHQQLRICAHFFADCTNCLNCRDAAVHVPEHHRPSLCFNPLQHHVIEASRYRRAVSIGEVEEDVVENGRLSWGRYRAVEDVGGGDLRGAKGVTRG